MNLPTLPRGYHYRYWLAPGCELVANIAERDLDCFIDGLQKALEVARNTRDEVEKGGSQ